MDDRIVPGHAGDLQQHRLHHGKAEVDAVEDLRGGGLLGHQLGKDGAGGLRLGEIVGADAHGGQHGGGKDQHAHAPQPVGEGAPEQHTPGHRLDVCEDGGPGGGETGGRFKHAVHKGGEAAAEPEGQGPEQAGGKPDQAHGHKALPGKEAGLGL